MIKRLRDLRSSGLKGKMQLSIIGFTSIIFITSAFVSVYRIRAIILENKHEIIEVYSTKCSNLLDMSIVQSQTQIETIKEGQISALGIPREKRRAVLIDGLQNSLKYNNHLVALWSEWEQNALDSLDQQYIGSKSATRTGRFSLAAYRDNEAIMLMDESLSDDGDQNSGFYQKTKSSLKPQIIPPYYDTYNGKDHLLILSVTTPILVNNKFKGVVGADINISQLYKIIQADLEAIDGRLFVVGSDGKLMLHDKENLIGKDLTQAFGTDGSYNGEFFKAIAEHKEGVFDFMDDGTKYLAYLHPTSVFGNDEITVVIIPAKVVTSAVTKIIFDGIIITLLMIILLYVVINRVVKGIVLPIHEVTSTLKTLGEGDFENTKKIDIHTNDELAVMSGSLNNLYDSIAESANFAAAIGRGELGTNLTSKGTNDRLGNALIAMQQSLKIAKEEEQRRRVEDEKQSWIEKGVAHFGDELRKSYDNHNDLYKNIIVHVVKYLGANQGALYLVNDNNPDDKFFEMVSCVAWDRVKMQQQRIDLEEGLLGACYFEMSPVILTEIPEDYIRISSGLGDANPQMLAIYPLINNEIFVGAIELASFSKFEEHQLTYINRITETFASSVVSLRVNARTSQLLEISQQQAEEMQAQEEEMRQNIEELHATQEEMRRKNAKSDMYQSIIESNFVTVSITPSFEILDINGNAAQMLGGSKEFFSQKLLTQFVDEGSIAALETCVERAALATSASCTIQMHSLKNEAISLNVVVAKDSQESGLVNVIGYKI